MFCGLWTLNVQNMNVYMDVLEKMTITKFQIYTIT